MTSRRYLAWTLATMLAAFALVWGYVVAAPMAFLEGGYAVWSAKQAMLRGCDLGRLAIFGDSQPEAAIVPVLLSQRAANISFGATTPVEMYFSVRRALRCPDPPARVVLTLDPMQFQNVSPFLWKNAARFGFLDFAELEAVRHEADALGDPAFARADTGDGLGGLPRDLLYAAHFPPLYFAALLKSQGFGRYASNRARRAEVLAARGFVPYPHPAGERPPEGYVAELAALDRFAPIALQDAYLRRTLDLLGAAGREVGLLTTPINQTTDRRLNPAVRAQFAAYLQDLAARGAHVHVLGAVLPPWPDRLFSDRNHLDPEGAAAYTRHLDACLGLPLPAACDFAWDTQ